MITKVADSVAKRLTKTQRRAERVSALASQVRALPAAKFGIVPADPPWRTETWSEKGMDRSPDNHYPTMALDKIMALPVPVRTADDCLLALWATVPHLEQALQVVNALGVPDYRVQCLLTWDKGTPGTGKSSINQTEHLIIATKGSVPAPGDKDKDFLALRAAQTQH